MGGLFSGNARLLAGVFGDAISVTPDTGDPFTVRGVFRIEAVEFDSGGQILMQRIPVLKVSDTDADLLSRDDRVVCDGTTYKVRDIQFAALGDDAEMVRIFLEHTND